MQSFGIHRSTHCHFLEMYPSCALWRLSMLEAHLVPWMQLSLGHSSSLTKTSVNRFLQDTSPGTKLLRHRAVRSLEFSKPSKLLSGGCIILCSYRRCVNGLYPGHPLQRLGCPHVQPFRWESRDTSFSSPWWPMMLCYQETLSLEVSVTAFVPFLLSLDKNTK